MTMPPFEEIQQEWARDTALRCQGFCPDAELNRVLHTQTDIATEVIRAAIAEQGNCHWMPKLAILGRGRVGTPAALTLVVIADGFDTPERKRATLFHLGQRAYAENWNPVAIYLLTETVAAPAGAAVLQAYGVEHYTQLPPTADRADKTELLTVVGCTVDGRACLAHMPTTTIDDAITWLGEPTYQDYDPATRQQPVAFLLNQFWRGVLLGAAREMLPQDQAEQIAKTVQEGNDGRTDLTH